MRRISRRDSCWSPHIVGVVSADGHHLIYAIQHMAPYREGRFCLMSKDDTHLSVAEAGWTLLFTWNRISSFWFGKLLLCSLTLFLVSWEIFSDFNATKNVQIYYVTYVINKILFICIQVELNQTQNICYSLMCFICNISKPHLNASHKNVKKNNISMVNAK